MIDFASRLDELYSFLDQSYSVGGDGATTDDDRDAIDILCAAMLHVPGAARSPNIILETDWLSRDCTPSWFAFGGAIIPHALGILQSKRVRYASLDIQDWSIAADKSGVPVVLVDPEWRIPRKWTKIHSGTGFSIGQTFSECLHVRARAPKTLGILQVDIHGAESRATRLRYLFNQVVKSELRPAIMPGVVIPPHFAYHCEIALKLAQARDGIAWEWLTNAVAGIAVRNAWLYGRTSVGEDDWRIAGRALAWQVPVWTAGMLARIDDYELPAVTPLALGRTTWRDYVGPEAGMLEIKQVRSEIVRLSRAPVGVLKRGEDSRWHPGRLGAQQEPIRFVDEETRGAVRRVLAGRAFC
jgi:hypothetical protein